MAEGGLTVKPFLVYINVGKIDETLERVPTIVPNSMEGAAAIV